MSLGLASEVVAELRAEGSIPQDGVQGRRATVRATWPLLWNTAGRWPRPDVAVLGSLPALDGELVVGGGPALSQAAFDHQGPARIYLRSWDEVPDLMARTGGSEVSHMERADWTISVLDLALPSGLLPPTVAVLEMGTTPRGRKQLGSARERFEAMLLGEAP